MSVSRVSTLTAAAFLVASTGSAATVDINVFSYGVGLANIEDAREDQKSFHNGGVTIVENFERFDLTPGVGGNGGPADSFTSAVIETRVGNFSSLNPTGNGSTNLTPTDQLHVRNGTGDDGGRFNTTLGGFNYLDSNDNSGIRWVVPGSAGLPAIFKLSFLATDIDDVGQNMFNIVASGDVVATTFTLSDTLSGQRPDGELLLFTLNFSTPVSNLLIDLNIDRGDGFSIDDAMVSAVPLPAAAWMLLAAVGSLFGLGRLRRAA